MVVLPLEYSVLFYLGPFEIVRTLKSRFLVIDGVEFVLVAFGI